MDTFDPVSGCSVRATSHDIPKWLLEPFRRLLRTHNPKATIDRLFESQHVQDLRLIVAFTVIAVLPVLIVGGPGALLYGWRHTSVLSALVKFVTFFAPVLGVFGAVLAWAYQAGSARLGIVDLFACEMDTICRVALVVESVSRSIAAFHRGVQSPGRHFTSEENYFPVFESNTGDLQTLEADVVVNITAFYTYMKATRDSTRALFDLSATPASTDPRADDAPALTPAQDAARNMIYMMFLGLESARKATAYLVEFEPERIERAIVILISELEAYPFLLDQFPDQDIRYQRLALRKPIYEKIVPRLCNLVQDGIAGKFAPATAPSEWEPASRLTDDLSRKRDAAIKWSRRPSRLAATA